jgi:hypothetical protein
MKWSDLEPSPATRRLIEEHGVVLWTQKDGRWSLVEMPDGTRYAVGSWWEVSKVTVKADAQGPILFFRSPVPALVRRACERYFSKGLAPIAA